VDASATRLLIFVTVLLLMMVLEHLSPKRVRQSVARRWSSNLALAFISVTLSRLLVPVSAVLLAEQAIDNGWGLMAKSPIPIPFLLDVALGIILLDLGVYLQHVLSHRIPFLWRIHRVHHTDSDIDVTTALRFHPLEILLSGTYKLLLVLIIGPVALSVIIFEILLNASAMFNHANLHIPKKLDSWLRWLVVTPDMHRVHHSCIERETDSNFGFFIPLWDRLFGTYCEAPEGGHKGMNIGLEEYGQSPTANLGWLLVNPFKR